MGNATVYFERMGDTVRIRDTQWHDIDWVLNERSLLESISALERNQSQYAIPAAYERDMAIREIALAFLRSGNQSLTRAL